MEPKPEGERSGIPKSTAVILGLILMLASVAVQAAWTMTVYTNTSVSGIHAEAFEIGDSLQVVSTDISVARDPLSPVGTQSTPLEIADGLPAGNALITKNHWTYLAVLEEKSLAAVTGGNFTVALYVNGSLLDRIYLTQQTSRTDKVEGATLQWDLGSSIPSDPLFLLKVTTTLPPSGPTVNFTMNANFNAFKGNSTGILNLSNPTLNISAGDTLRITIRGDDGMTHNIQFRTSGGTTLATSADVDLGQTTTLSYTFTSAGTYTYRCQYHTSTMVGTINVA